jgi:arabinofuranosyltransferase
MSNDVGVNVLAPADRRLAPVDRAVRTSERRDLTSAGRAGWAVVAASCAAFLALCWHLRGFVTDDAWISVRYAENLAQGHGPVWNPGGAVVEGFSNPLLVLVEALAAAAGWSALGAARLLGVACGLACVVLVYARGRDVVGETAARAAAVLTGACAPFALWAVGGLETLVVAAALTAATLEAARPRGGNPILLGALLAVLPWLRPEGLAVAGPLALLSQAPGLLSRSTRRRAAVAGAWAVGIPVASQAVLEAVRLAVYGHLLPNSVLYKSGTGEPLLVLEKFVDQALPVLALAAVGLALARGRRLLLALPLLIYVAGSIGTLDSANSYSRFFMPTWPQVALLAGVAVAALAGVVAPPGRPGRGWAVTALVAAAALVPLVLPPSDIRSVAGWEDRYTDCRVGAREDLIGWLRSSTPASASFSISDAGLVPARAGGRPVQDQFLLNDPLIQETGPLAPRERADLVHRRGPDVIVLVSSDPDRFQPLYPTGREILQHRGMTAYDLAHVARGDGPSCRYHLFAYARR